MKTRFAALAALALSLAFSAPAMADGTPVKERRTPVLVEFEGVDVIGATLSAKLREELGKANPANPEREAVFRLMLSSASEFDTRPSAGSVYAVVWSFSPSGGSMEYYLARDMGVVTPDNMDNVIRRLIQRTEGVSARYGYLDRDKK